MNHDGLWCARSVHDGRVVGPQEHGARHWSRGAGCVVCSRATAAAAATESGHFSGEIAPVPVAQRKGDPVIVTADEGIRRYDSRLAFAVPVPPSSRMARLRRVTRPRSPMGAAAVVLADADAADAAGLPCWRPFADTARLEAPMRHCTTVPAEALRIALKRGMKPGNLDLVEVNEGVRAVAPWSASMPARHRCLPTASTSTGSHRPGHPLGATEHVHAVTLINARRRQRGRSLVQRPCAGVAGRATPSFSKLLANSERFEPGVVGRGDLAPVESGRRPLSSEVVSCRTDRSARASAISRTAGLVTRTDSAWSRAEFFPIDEAIRENGKRPGVDSLDDGNAEELLHRGAHPSPRKQ